MKYFITLLVVLLVSCGGGSSTSPTTVVLGDSITLRTGQCSSTDTLASCAAADRDQSELSYATYITDVVSNQGRGGDTCTTQASFGPGPFNSLPRGVLQRVQTSIALHPSQISVLIGINDLDAGWNVPVADVISCITQVWDTISAAGIEPIALTYGRMTAFTGWQQLNPLIRAEAAKRGLRVVDFETITYTSIDGIHPDLGTAEAMGALWMKTIR